MAERAVWTWCGRSRSSALTGLSVPPRSPEGGQASVWLSDSRQAGSVRAGLALP